MKKQEKTKENEVYKTVLDTQAVAHIGMWSNLHMPTKLPCLFTKYQQHSLYKDK